MSRVEFRTFLPYPLSPVGIREGVSPRTCTYALVNRVLSPSIPVLGEAGLTHLLSDADTHIY